MGAAGAVLSLVTPQEEQHLRQMVRPLGLMLQSALVSAGQFRVLEPHRPTWRQQQAEAGSMSKHAQGRQQEAQQQAEAGSMSKHAQGRQQQAQQQAEAGSMSKHAQWRQRGDGRGGKGGQRPPRAI